MNERVNMIGAGLPNDNKRESLRIDKTLSARVRDNICTVLNISNKGVLLETPIPMSWSPLSDDINFDLEIGGEWISIDGIVKWVVSDQEHSRVGVFIKIAPSLYLDYLKDLYS